MIGAIVTTGVFALLCSGLATIGNLAIARDFPDVKLENDTDVYSDPFFDPAVAVLSEQYRLTTNLFYHQARVFRVVPILLARYTFLIVLL